MKSIIVTVSLLVSICSAVAQTNVIFPRQGTIWKYNQTNNLYAETAGGIGWTLIDYDDSGPSWQEGPALLSNDTGNGNIAPLIQSPLNHPNTPNALYGGLTYHARYFRKKFTYNDPVAPFTQLQLNRRFDDGVIIWLNGVEIGRVNFTSTTFPAFDGRSECFSCQTGPCTGGGDAECEEFTLLPADQLIQGENVIAFALHQTGGTSSDITFGTSLEVILPRAPTIISNSEPADRVVLQNRTHTLRVYAEASPAPTYQWFYSATQGGPFAEIQDATNSSYTITSMQQANEGYYYATVSNVIDTVTSRTAFIDYSEDTAKPIVLGALGSRDFATVVVQFNEALDPATSVDPFNWGILDPNSTALELDPTTPATLSANGAVVTLFLAPGVLLAENTVYTVLASGITDATLLPENTMEDTNVTFRSFVSGCGTFLFEAFDTVSTPGNAITLLTSHPNYPNNPRDVANAATFDSRHGYNNDSHEQYGGRMRGLFVPLISGPHTFYLASDDAGQLFVNPNGPEAAGKQLVAEETGCCNNFLPAPNARTSVPINLTAGSAYYVEALYKEGTGGDWLKIAVRPSGDPVPAGGNSDQAGLSPNAMPGGAGPAGILSHVTIASQPASQSRIAGQTAAFSVGLSIDVPGCFQWRRDDGTGYADIPGAVGPNYRFVTSLADDGAKFQCAVLLMGGTALLSAEATLSVQNDITPPTVTSVAQDLAGNITVTFSEPMDVNSLTNGGSYAIDAVPPASVTPLGNNAVVLTPSAPMAPCPISHTVTVGNVRDANTVLISPNPTHQAFTLNGLLVLPINASQNWRYNDAGVDIGGGWEAIAYDDSTWSNGTATLAFPAGEVIAAGFPVRTVLAGVRPTTYFRTHFNMPSDPSSVTNLQLNVILDDGGIVYLNGQELTRIRMGAGAPTFDALSSASSPSDPPQILETYSVPPGALAFGDNVLAVRVHQSSATSSDTVLAAGLVAQVTGCVGERPRLKIEQNGNQVTISLKSGPNGTIYRSSSLQNPTWISVGQAPQTLNIGPGNQFFEIRP